jgi:ankyrin repeat protein
MMRKGFAGALILLIRILLVAGGTPSALLGQDFDNGFEKTAQLIVMIDVDYGDTPEFGAGIVFGRDGNHALIATAYHVVHRGPTQPSRILVRFRTMRDTPVEAKVLHHGLPGEMDLAVLSVDTPKSHGFDVCALPFARLGNAASVQRRTLVSPVGNPNGTPWGVPVGPDQVSGVEGNEFVFQSAVISSGHSGGGLLDSNGNLLGMTIADQPPFGRAINIDAVIKTLKQWGYPVRISPVLDKGWTPLHLAAANGDLATITSLLDCDGVNVVDDHKSTPLHQAASKSRGDTEVMSLLLKAGANIEAQDADGDTPLSWAAENRNVEAVQFLLRAGAKTESRNHSQETVLYVAAKQWYGVQYRGYEVVKLLISAHADVNALDAGGVSPLEILGRGGPDGRLGGGPEVVETAKLLVAAGGKLRASALVLLAEGGRSPNDLMRLEAVLPGVTNLEDEVSPEGTLLDVAAAEENIDTARVLVAAGAKINGVRHNLGAHNNLDIYAYKTPLFLAIKHGLKDGMAPRAKELVPFLVAHGGLVRVPGTTEAQLEELLRDSVVASWKTAVEILLAAGTNPNAPEYLKHSASIGILSIAKEKGDQDIVKLLVDAGAK